MRVYAQIGVHVSFSLSRYAYPCASVYACIHVCRSLHFLRASMCHSELHSDLCAIWPRIMHFTCRTQLLSRTRNCLISICKPPLTPTPFKTPACVGNGHSIIRIHSFVFKFYINKKEIHSKQQLLWEQKKNTHSRTHKRWIRVLHHCRIEFKAPESYILWICIAFIYKFYILMQVSLLYIYIYIFGSTTSSSHHSHTHIWHRHLVSNLLSRSHIRRSRNAFSHFNIVF